MPPSPVPLPRLTVTSLSQYVRLDNCDRFLRFRLHPAEPDAMLERWGLTIQPLTVLLKESGAAFEDTIVEQLRARGERVENLAGATVEETVNWLRTARAPVTLLQPPLEAPLGEYIVHGTADLVRLHRDRRGILHVLVADIKASRTERMEHRLQVALYARLLHTLATLHHLPIAPLRGQVLHIQEHNRAPDFDPDAPGFELDSYESVIDRLVSAPDSIVNRIVEQPLAEVPFHLGYKCDGCLYNALCMTDAAERMELSLVPHLTATEKRTLQQNGLRTLPDLAPLMELPPRGADERALAVPPEQAARVAHLANQWPVGPNLPLLVQRARRALYRFDRSVAQSTWMVGSGFGTLPDDSEHPDLLKVFFDAQHDFLQDRVYLVSALVKGPRGERSIVRLSDGPPSEEGERALLVGWVAEVVQALRAVAASERAPIHLYCFSRYDQSVLLEALKRHLSAVAGLPAFFDLMTQSPALSQPIISFLADEVAQRRNLGIVCNALHDAARMLGFNWEDGTYRFWELFRARIFDNRRTVRRQPDGTLAFHERAPDSFPIESASRFSSQIPLEYAYAAWQCLPPPKPGEARLDPFLAVTVPALRAFAIHRCRAVAHLEASFRTKARFLDKPALELPTLGAPPAGPTPLARGLEEFLFMEHHAALQDKLQQYSLPIERRAASGNALLLRYLGPDGDHHRFAFALDELGLDPTLALNQLRLREGEWTVLNEADGPPLSADRIKQGRLAIIQSLTPTSLTVELLGMSFWKYRFRYPHHAKLLPQIGARYTLDPMADDLNADKALDALHHTDSNTLYRWLLQRPAARPLPPTEQQAFDTFLRQVEAVEGRKKPTGPQQEVIAGRAAEPLLLVQGPPGTGKSHTIGWAILARLAVAAAQGRPCRVAVVCKTHSAIAIVLDSVADKLHKLTTIPTPLTQPLAWLQVYKCVNSADETLPPHVVAVDPYSQTKRNETLLGQPLLVLGSTPGHLHTLARNRPGSKGIEWAEHPFDLLVIDEASQMSLPEAMLAGAFLHPAGSALVVGDHRQMPPIIAHPWEQEQRRSATTTQPHRSLFETLLDHGAPRVALDQSFRLHREVAAFLQHNIYSRDGITFYSRRTDRLDTPPPVNPFVDQALDPAYPLVVIEHQERGSRQFNPFEAALISPLIEVCATQLRLDGLDGIGVVVPHRAQKALLRERFPDLAATHSIDTVERFQGGERDVIIVSATASDPDYVLAEASFLLNLNRLNVALSRPRKKLIVVASRAVIDLLTSDLAIWDNAIIWKRLYHHYAPELLWQGEQHRIPTQVRGRRA